MYKIFESLLKEKQIRPSDVSKATGISPSALSDWKTGRSTPKADKLQKIADYLGVTLDYLTTGKNLDGEPISAEQRLLVEVCKEIPPEDLSIVLQVAMSFKQKDARLRAYYDRLKHENGL